MKKFLLTLIVTMLTAIGAWADGVVTLEGVSSGTIDLNLYDDGSGKVFGISSPVLAEQQGNSQFSFVCYDENGDVLSSQDIVELTTSFVWAATGHTLKIKPLSTGSVRLQLIIKNQYNTAIVDKSEIITVSVNNEQKIPATLSGVPSSIRMGNTGTAVVNVDGFTADDDYTVVFSSTDESVIKVDAATGVLTPVAAGNATIKALVTPTTTGSAASYVAKTLEANVEVKAEITATWNGSIANTSIPLGVQTTQSSDYPQAIWSESIAGATTVYSVISDDETVVKGHFTLQDNKPNGFVLAGIKAGTTNVSIKAEYGMWEYPGGVATWNPITEKISDPVEVTVTPIDVKLTVSPSTDLTMDVSLTDGETRGLTTTVVDGFGVTKSASVTAGDDVVDLSINQEGTQLTIKPKAGAGVGTATVTVKAVWAKALNHPYAESGTEEREVSFNVTVDDKTLVKALVKPNDQEVQQGKANPISVLFAPSTAVFDAPSLSENDANVTVAYATEGGNTDYTTLVVTVPDDATLIGKTAKITLNPKTGSSALAQTFTVTVGKKELPITDETNNAVMSVGEFFPYKPVIDPTIPEEDYVMTYTCAGVNKDGEDVVTVSVSGGNVTANHIGTSLITYTFTPREGTATYNNYKACTSKLKVNVKPAKPTFTLSVDPVTFNVNASEQTGNIEYSISGDGYPVTDALENIKIVAEGATNVSVVGNSTLKLAAKAPAQQFVVKATYDPNNEDYEPISSSVKILVTDPSAQVTISVDADGVYTVNIPSPGAFGVSLDDPVSDEKAELVVPATLDGLKNAANVKVTGLLANSDVKELIRLIGESNTGVEKDADGNYLNVCKSLDMGDATMTEALALKKDTEGNITANWDESSWIENYWSCNLWYLEDFTLPKPVPESTVIPTGMYQLWKVDSRLFNSLTIPEGWTVVGDHAFADGSGNGLLGLTELSIPNTVKNIGKYAFQNLGIKTLYLPNQLETIDEGAFDVTGNAGTVAGNKISPLQDVYFTGPAPRFVHTAAFATCSQMANNTCDDKPKEGKHMPEATRLDYSVATALACLMHYPKEYESEYIDETRVYYVADTREVEYNKGNPELTYTPDGWTNAFIAAVNAKKTAGTTMLYSGNKIDGGFLDVTYGAALVWPSHYQMTTGYTIANAGYKWNGEPLDPDTQYEPGATVANGKVDRRGLYQFIVAVGNAPDDPHEWKFKFEQDKWYTISLPFDMTPAEIRKVFGNKTQVCRFSEVVRQTSSSAPKVLKLIFKKSVMVDEDDDATKENIKYYYNEVGAVSQTPVYKAGIRHHHPYMIKPSGTVDSDPNIKFNPETGERVFVGYKSVPGSLEEEAVGTSDAGYSESRGIVNYYFRANMMQAAIKKNSYVLTKDKNNPDIHKFIFYKGKKVNGVYVDGGTQVANSGYVQLAHGEEDLAAFFAETIYTPASKSIFGIDEDDDSATEIEKVVIVCGNDKDEDGKVYSINGQLVNGNNLPAGLYIKNGKKFIVK